MVPAASPHPSPRPLSRPAPAKGEGIFASTVFGMIAPQPQSVLGVVMLVQDSLGYTAATLQGLKTILSILCAVTKYKEA